MRPLFRENAIKNLSALDDFNITLKVIQPGSWAWVWVAFFLLAGFFVWSVYSQISLSVVGNGIILSENHLEQTEKFLSENRIERRNKIDVLKNLLDKKEALFKKHYITISDLEKAREEYVTAKEESARLSSESYAEISRPIFSSEMGSSGVARDALVFVNHTEGKQIAAGMEAYLLPNSLSVYQYGYIQGEVVGVSEYPASKASVYSYLGNINLVDQFFTDGVPYMIKIRLKKNSQTQSGLAWTTSKGAPFSIAPGTTVSVKVINKKCSPLRLVSMRGECQ